MNAISVLRNLGPVDLKGVRRDPLLAWAPFIPLVMALVLRIGVPRLANLLQNQLGFDLSPFYPLIMSSFVIMMPGIVGTVIGFLLLDERDAGVFRALQVTPMPPAAYLTYRLGFPTLLGIVVTLVCYPIAGLTSVRFVDLLAVSALGSIGAPLMALILASFAANKVAGFALMKILNAVGLIPTLAYFVEGNAQLLAGIIPTYWPMKVFWLAAAGETYAAHLGMGFVVNVVALWLLMKRFDTVVHR